jgi:hypothetical protein
MENIENYHFIKQLKNQTSNQSVAKNNNKKTTTKNTSNQSVAIEKFNCKQLIYHICFS